MFAGLGGETAKLSTKSTGTLFWTYLLGTLIGLPLPIAGYCLFFDALSHRWLGNP